MSSIHRNLLTGEPYAGKPLVRFGGREPQINAAFLPLSLESKVRSSGWVLPRSAVFAAQELVRVFVANDLFIDAVPMNATPQLV